MTKAFSGLAPREREAILIAAEGLGVTAIAVRMGVDRRVAGSYLKGARRKLQAPTLPAAVATYAAWLAGEAAALDRARRQEGGPCATR